MTPTANPPYVSVYHRLCQDMVAAIRARWGSVVLTGNHKTLDDACQRSGVLVRTPCPHHTQCSRYDDLREMRCVAVRLVYVAEQLLSQPCSDEIYNVAERLLGEAMSLLTARETGFTNFKRAITLRSLAVIYRYRGRGEKTASTLVEALDLLLAQTDACTAYRGAIVPDPREPVGAFH